MAPIIITAGTPGTCTLTASLRLTDGTILSGEPKRVTVVPDTTAVTGPVLTNITLTAEKSSVLAGSTVPVRNLLTATASYRGGSTGTPDTDITNGCEWSFSRPDSTLPSVPSVSNGQFAIPAGGYGNFTVRCEKDGRASNPKTITVVPQLPTAITIAGPSTTPKIGEPVTITNTTALPASRSLQYQWTITPEPPSSSAIVKNQPALSFTPASTASQRGSGTYRISLTVTLPAVAGSSRETDNPNVPSQTRTAQTAATPPAPTLSVTVEPKWILAAASTSGKSCTDACQEQSSGQCFQTKANGTANDWNDEHCIKCLELAPTGTTCRTDTGAVPSINPFAPFYFGVGTVKQCEYRDTSATLSCTATATGKQRICKCE